MRRTKEAMLALRAEKLEEARKGLQEELKGKGATANVIFQYAFFEGWKARGEVLNGDR